jgi:hypothetical protein
MAAAVAAAAVVNRKDAAYFKYCRNNTCTGRRRSHVVLPVFFSKVGNVKI